MKSDQGSDTASVSYTIDKANGTASVAAGTVIVKLDLMEMITQH